VQVSSVVKNIDFPKCINHEIFETVLIFIFHSIDTWTPAALPHLWHTCLHLGHVHAASLSAHFWFIAQIWFLYYCSRRFQCEQIIVLDWPACAKEQ